MYDWAEFRHFKFLLAVLKHKGFRAAVDHVFTAQPNLSKYAKEFQEQSGLVLFRKRKDRRVSLTETGIAFLSIGQGVLEARDEAFAALLAIQRGEIRSLRLGCSPYADPAVFLATCELHREMVPSCPIRAAYSETVELAEEVLSGELDAAIVIMPVKDQRLRIETIRRDRLVACLPSDHPCAIKATLQPSDLQENLAVFYDPQQHPLAHDELKERLVQIGVIVKEFSRASHPTEMCELVKQGYGFALIREGSVSDPKLVTRPIAGVDWTVETAIIYNQQQHLKTVPVLVRHLKNRLTAPASRSNQSTANTRNALARHFPEKVKNPT